MQSVRAVIMAGGQGSRLRPLTCDRPKPMVPVLGVPLMGHILRLLAGAGIGEAVATLHLMPEQVMDGLGDGSAWGVRLQHLVEERPLGTAGSVARARALLDGTAVVISGDALTDVDLGRVLAFHRERGAACTLVLRQVGDPSEYGIVITEPDGRITRFLEKPGRGQVFSDQANTGIYVLEPEVLERVPEGRPFDFSRELFPLLLEAGVPLYGCPVEAYWSDIGTPEQYRQAHLDALAGRVRLPEAARAPGRWAEPGIWVGEGARVAPEARLLAPCWVGPGCEIEAGAEVGPFAALGRGCWVGPGASVRHSVLWEACRVGPGAELRGAVLAEAVTVGRGARLYEGAVVGRRARVGQAAVVAPGVRIWPEKVVDAHGYVSRPLVWAGTPSRVAVGPRGLAGEAGTELTPELAAAAAGAFAATLPPGSALVVAHAGGRAARALAMAAAAGAASAGAAVRWLGEAAAGEARQACRHAGARPPVAGGIYVHPDGADGGVRLRLWNGRGADLPAARAREVDGALRRDEWRRVGEAAFGAVEPDEALLRDAREAYLTALADRVRLLAGRLAAATGDAGTGAGGGGAGPAGQRGGERAAGEAGCRVGVLGARESPAARLVVRALRVCGFVPVRVAADRPPAEAAEPDGPPVRLWVRQDAAGERLEAWDRRGLPVPEAALHAVAALGTPQDGAVRLPADASDLAAQLARQAGLAVVWDDRGAEPGDAVALACLAAAAAAAPGGLDALARDGPVPARLQLAVPVAWERVGQAMRALAQRAGAPAQPAAEGFKVRHETGWALVQPDPDRPLVRLQVEAATLDDARDLLQRYADYVRAAARGPDPPPGPGP
ncbi:MAG TPA: sugar phosphate nucleotidyltransferase [Limnochordales bacterium]